MERFGKENVKVYTTSFTSMYYSMMEKEDKAPTKYKIVCQGPQEKVVGLHILGLGSGEMLQGFSVAIVSRPFSCVTMYISLTGGLYIENGRNQEGF